VAKCDYQNLPTGPGCTDDTLLKVVMDYQAINENYNLPLNWEACTLEAHDCSVDVLKNAMQAKRCENTCRPQFCNFAGGLCQQQQQASVCLRPGDNEACLECAPPAVQYYTNCVSRCPRGFSLRRGVCLPMTDKSSLVSPDLIYVREQLGYEGDGSAANPYGSLVLALAAVWSRYTTILLIGDQVTVTVENLPEAVEFFTVSNTDPLKNKSFTLLLLRSLRCSENSLHGCSNDMTQLDYSGTVVSFTCKGAITLLSLTLSGLGFFPGPPSYCPAVKNGKDDRNKDATNEASDASLICSNYASAVFFSVKAEGSLTLQHVSVSDFAIEMLAFIQIDGGGVTLEDVEFQRNTAKRTGKSALILQTGPCQTCGAFIYTDGSVFYQNNGFEYDSEEGLSPFLYLESMQAIIITDVEFAYNSVLSGDQGTSAVSSLLYMEAAIALLISGCTFHHNLAKDPLVYVKSTLVLPIDPDDEKVVQSYKELHINLNSLRFSNNFGLDDLVRLTITADVLNIELSDCTFLHNSRTSGSVVTLQFSGKATTQAVSGGYINFSVNKGRKQKVYLAARSVVIQRLSFKDEKGFQALLGVTSYPNVRISSVTIEDCGDALTWRAADILAAFIADSTTYMSLAPELGPNLLCKELIDVQALTNFTFSSSLFSRNTCHSGGAGLLLGNCQGNVMLSGLTAVSNSGKGSGGVVLSTQGSLTLSISGFTVRNSKSEEGHTCRFHGQTTLTLSSSEFTSNAGPVLYFDSGAQVRVQSCSFSSNVCAACVGGALWYSAAGPTSRLLLISDSTFLSDQAVSAGSLYISASDSSNVLSLQVLRTTFTKQTASLSGSAIIVDSGAQLATDSVLSACSFRENSSLGAAVELHFAAGSLSLSDCTFDGNSGSVASGLLVSSGSSTTVTLTRISFLNSSRGPALLKADSRLSVQLESSQCVFTSATHSCLVLEGGAWRDTGSQFQACGSSAVMATSGAGLELTWTNFQSNRSAGNGGAVSLGSKSSFKCTDCQFSLNSAGVSGGAVFAEQDSSLTVVRATFQQNAAVTQGSAIYLTASTTHPAIIKNCRFAGNSAGFDGTISALSSSLALENVTLTSNFAPNCPGISLLMSSLTLSNSTFASQNGTAAFLSLATSSSAALSDSAFSEGSGTASGALVCAGSTVSMLRCALSSLTGTQAGAVYGTNCEVGMTQTSLRNMTSPGGTLALLQCSLRLTKSSFQDCSGVVGTKLTSVSLSETSFLNSPSYSGFGLVCSACAGLSIDTCDFRYLKATEGAALYIDNSDLSTSQRLITVLNSSFVNCSAQKGGAVYLTNAHLEASRSTWTNNTADPGEGGGLYLDCEKSGACTYALSNCTFLRNRSTRMGGGLAWVTAQPTLSSLISQANSAPYGPLNASFAVQLLISNISSHSGRLLVGEVTEAPGQSANAILTAALVDHYGQVVSLDNESTAELVSSDLTAASVSGVSRVAAVNGIFTFSNYLIYADPNSTAAITIATTGIKTPYAKYPSSVSLAFNLRACLPGESQATKSCLVCGSGTYGFDPTQPCQNCPQNAQCPGNKTVLPEAGYWRAELLSADILKCPNAGACLGGTSQDQLGQCAEGYTGPLCQSCKPDFSHSSKNSCSKCPSLSLNVMRLGLILLAAVCILTLLVWSTLRSAHRPAALHSIYLKILMNYLQLVLLTADFKLNWPEIVQQLFEVQNSAGGVTEQAFSVDCFLADNQSTSSSYYRKMTIMVILPIALVLLSVLFWTVIAIKKREKRLLTRELAATIVILFFLIHPNLVKMLFSMFSCEAVNGDYWLTVDMAIPCWNSEHVGKLLTVGLPGVVVWVFGIPTVCLGVLVRFRRRHDELWVKLQYGFLINGYRRQQFYWEFVILYRKIIIICCGVFLAGTVPVQALTVQLVLLVALFWQYDTGPYTTSTLNKLELRAIVVADVTIYCGLYYLTENLSPASSWFFFLAIVVVNAVFLTYWAVIMLSYILQVLAANIPCLGRLLNPDRMAYNQDIEDLITLKVHSTKPFAHIITLCSLYRLLLKSEQTIPCSIPSFRTKKEHLVTRTESLFEEHVRTAGLESSFSFQQDSELHAKSP